LELVLNWRARLGVRHTVLTHMGIDMDFNWLLANLPPGVEAAVDGQMLEVRGSTI
jgi:phosphoribosyl 1,2-cyclic phosphate phosphodiesterase